jgi:hypothetical protein
MTNPVLEEPNSGYMQVATREIIENEAYNTISLIRKKSVDKVACILRDKGYEVSRNVPEMGYEKSLDRFVDDSYHINNIVATKDIGKSYLYIQINLSEKRLFAFSRFLEFSTSIPFHDHSNDDLLRAIRKSPKYRR